MAKKNVVLCESFWDSSREAQGLKADNLHLYSEYITEGQFQMPLMEATDYVPEHGLVPFNLARNCTKYEKCVHGFIYDHHFNPLWTCPERFIERLRKFDGVITPDFSLYEDMSHAQRIWNTYRTRLLGCYWQTCGLTVIPSASWNAQDTFAYCFDGLPEESTIAVSSQGTLADSYLMHLYRTGVKELIARKHPSTLLVYGKEVDADYGDTPVKFCENEYLADLKKRYKQQQKQKTKAKGE